MSLFADTLRGLLDDTNLFSREDWAFVIGAHPDRIESWLIDGSIPAPHYLLMIVIALEESANVPEAPLKAFKEMSLLPARTVSPFGSQMLSSVHEYMYRLEFSDLSTRLARLSPEERGKLLETLYPDV